MAVIEVFFLVANVVCGMLGLAIGGSAYLAMGNMFVAGWMAATLVRRTLR
ncbi:hypothetical protein [Tardibacter chloracetimidivorans]|nr:hypothetical protein [Tardibacter chloracetimidivorans]